MIMKRKLHFVVTLSFLAIFTISSQIQAAERSMVLSGSGGYVAEISQKIWMEPFTKATGIKIKRVYMHILFSVAKIINMLILNLMFLN